MHINIVLTFRSLLYFSLPYLLYLMNKEPKVYLRYNSHVLTLGTLHSLEFEKTP